MNLSHDDPTLSFSHHTTMLATRQPGARQKSAGPPFPHTDRAGQPRSRRTGINPAVAPVPAGHHTPRPTVSWVWPASAW